MDALYVVLGLVVGGLVLAAALYLLLRARSGGTVSIRGPGFEMRGEAQRPPGDVRLRNVAVGGDARLRVDGDVDADAVEIGRNLDVRAGTSRDHDQ